MHADRPAASKRVPWLDKSKSDEERYIAALRAIVDHSPHLPDTEVQQYCAPCLASVALGKLA